ncbi:hypothetical protein C8J57DRAFT_1231976 [Mycena rebaudengoi]|nr:hypothetical protein C8J57DRAFT_1231976 [Mycena rebaudengoi]
MRRYDRQHCSLHQIRLQLVVGSPSPGMGREGRYDKQMRGMLHGQRSTLIVDRSTFDVFDCSSLAPPFPYIYHQVYVTIFSDSNIYLAAAIQNNPEIRTEQMHEPMARHLRLAETRKPTGNSETRRKQKTTDSATWLPTSTSTSRSTSSCLGLSDTPPPVQFRRVLRAASTLLILQVIYGMQLNIARSISCTRRHLSQFGTPLPVQVLLALKSSPPVFIAAHRAPPCSLYTAPRGSPISTASQTLRPQLKVQSRSPTLLCMQAPSGRRPPSRPGAIPFESLLLYSPPWLSSSLRTQYLSIPDSNILIGVTGREKAINQY